MKEKQRERFVVRVYGLAVHDNCLLVSDEFWFGTPMTKLPGGGLEFGEGLIDCLKRECLEEFGQEVRVQSHFYTTDYFQPARFLPNRQLISVYYLMQVPDPGAILTSPAPDATATAKGPDAMHEDGLGSQHPQEGILGFRWIGLDALRPDDMTLPVDRKVVEMLLERKKVGACALNQLS